MPTTFVVPAKSSYFLKLLLAILVSALCGCIERRAVVFEIPQGYVGWIRIKYNIASTAALPVRNGSYIARIPANGLLKTSTVEQEGGGLDEFYYVTQSGKAKPMFDDNSNPNSLVWADAGRTNERRMFIGTKKQWNDAERLIGGQDPGPLQLPIGSNAKRN